MKLSPDKMKKLIMLNAAIVITDILLFSKAFLGLSLLGGTAFSLSLAWTAVAMSVIVFYKGNSIILGKKELRQLTQNIQSIDGCVEVFRQAIHHGDVFDENILKNIDQVKRVRRKQETIKDILLQKFSRDEMSFQKFESVLAEVESVIYMNMRSILNKIAAFDVIEYEAMQRKGVNSDDYTQEKWDIYNDYIDFVNRATKTNEEIILKLDKMLLEISRYNSMDDGDLQKLPAMLEMDELIRNANLYK